MPTPFYYFKKIKAQSLIQYLVIITLVMASVIIAGPHAIRGWNAHLKALDDSVQDSYNDQMIEAPADDIIIAGCDCSWLDKSCDGSSTIPGVNMDCDPLEMLQELDCTPHGCEISSGMTPLAQCVPNSTCCILTLGSVPGDCGASAVPPCPPGQLRSTQTCGGSPPTTTSICAPNPGCTGTCATPPLPSTGAWCSGDDSGVPPFPYPFPVTPVPSGGCTAPVKCEFECTPPLVPVGGNCACPPNETVITQTPTQPGTTIAIAHCSPDFRLRQASCQWIGPGAPGRKLHNEATPDGYGWECRGEPTTPPGTGGFLKAQITCRHICNGPFTCGDGVFNPDLGEKCDNGSDLSVPPKRNQANGISFPGFPLGHHQMAYSPVGNDKACQVYNCGPSPACSNWGNFNTCPYQLCENNCQTIGFEYPIYQIGSFHENNAYFSAHSINTNGTMCYGNCQWRPLRITCPAGKVFKFMKNSGGPYGIYKYNGCEYSHGAAGRLPWCANATSPPYGNPAAPYQGECQSTCDMWCGTQSHSNSSYYGFVCVAPSACP